MTLAQPSQATLTDPWPPRLVSGDLRPINPVAARWLDQPA